MKKIVAFAGSTSSTSINKKLVEYAVSHFENFEVTLLDMRDYTAELFSVDKEKNGFPKHLIELSNQFKTYDAFVISLAEHNGSYAAAYKNTIDWLSRIDRAVFANKPMLLMATSPGGRGGTNVLEAAKMYYPALGADVRASFSLPNFYESFDKGIIVNKEKDVELKNAVAIFIDNLK